MMLCLDCESIDGAYRSVGAILHLSRRQLDASFENFDFERYVEQHGDDPDYDVDLVMLKRLISRYRVTPDPTWSATCFFHLTRTLDASQFFNGIDPLIPERVDAIWAGLYSLVSNDMSPDVWEQFRRRMETDQTHHSARGLYQLRVKGLQRSDGPYGMLIRASAFHAEELRNHDYLKLPEIIEDIGLCCQAWYSIPLLKRFQQKAKPCIVKFRVEGRALFSDLGVAVNYISSSLEEEDPYILTPSYSAGGTPIAAAQIERIECPPGHVLRARAAKP